MNDLWKYGIVAIASLLIGFSLGYLADFPEQITFDATPRLLVLANETKADLVKLSELSLNRSLEECPIRLAECEKLYPIYVKGLN